MVPIRRVLISALVLLLGALTISRAQSSSRATSRVPSNEPHSLRDVPRRLPGLTRDRSFWSERRGRTDGRSPVRRSSVPGNFSIEATARPEESPLLSANHFASQVAASSDEPYAAVVDFSGNCYITGSSTRLPFGSDYLTVKLGPAGNLLWAVRYAGHTVGENIAQAVAVDGLGNVYVTGGSPDVHFWDIATVKYNALGVQQWVARWGSELGLHDGGNAITVDESGNVYVAGWTMDEARDYDIVVLCYSPQGEELWQRHYDGPIGQQYANLNAMGLAPAPSGSVYVAMTTSGADGSDDILVLRLDSQGVELWREQFTGPLGSDNVFQAMSLDPSGALILGAQSDGWGTEEDFLVLKYGSTGLHDWTARYDGPASSGQDWLLDITVDDSGNVYACGFPDDYSFNAALVCLDRHGNEKWVQYHTSPGTAQDIVENVRFVPPAAIRLSGEAYPADPSQPNEIFVVQFDTAGSPVWEARRVLADSRFSFAIGAGWEPSGASYIFAYGDTESERTNYAVMKVGPGGSVLSEAQYDGPGTSYDDAQVGWVHPSGAISLGGYTLVGGSRTRARTIKFEADGSLAWVQQYFSPEDSICSINAITGDRQGNTYVAGWTYEPASDLDIVTIKYTPEGVEAWKERYIWPQLDTPAGIATDDSGNVYVLGTLDDYSLNATFLILKYDSLGNRLWDESFQTPWGSANTAFVLSAFPGGGVCYAGESYTPGQGQSMVTVRLRPDGTVEWVAYYTSPSGYRATPYAMAVTDSGVVYVAGTVPGASGGYDPIVVRYGASGSEDWTLTVEGSGTWEAFTDIAVAPQGTVYLLGDVQHDPMQTDVLVMSLGADGQELWRREYASPAGGDDNPSSICVDSLGEVYVTASCESPETESLDCVVLKYDGTGEVKDLMYFPGPGTSMEEPVTSGIDAEGNLLIGGTERGSRSNWSVMRALKFGPSLTGVDPVVRGLPARYRLDQNYPNPFNPSTVIQMAVPERSHVRLVVSNLLGQHVAILVDRVLDAGIQALEFDATRLPSGVYLYTMTAGMFVQSRKMIVLR